MTTSSKKLIRVLKGERLDPPPIWLMRQAGRYLPEYRAVRQKAGSFLDLCFDPALASEVTLQPIRRFGFDAAILFADILLVPHGLGQKVWFVEGEGPRLQPVTTFEDLRGLVPADAAERLKPVFETVARVKSELPRDCALIGFAGAPWTVATYMIAGRGTPDQAAAKRLAYHAPDIVDRLLALIENATIDYLDRQIAAGAEIIQLFDTWAGGLSPALMRRCVIEPTARLTARLKRDHPNIPIIGFPRGIGTWAEPYARETGVDALGIGTGENALSIRSALGPAFPLQGALDPLVLVEGGAALKNAARASLDFGRSGPYIFNLGHGILPETPPEHVGELVEMVRGA